MSKIVGAVKGILNDWVAELKENDKSFFEDGTDLITIEEINGLDQQMVQVCLKLAFAPGNKVTVPTPIYWVILHEDSVSIGSILVYEDVGRISINDPSFLTRLRGMLNASLHQTLDMIAESDHVDIEWSKVRNSPDLSMLE